jgi:hypothetical protein
MSSYDSAGVVHQGTLTDKMLPFEQRVEKACNRFRKDVIFLAQSVRLNLYPTVPTP